MLAVSKVNLLWTVMHVPFVHADSQIENTTNFCDKSFKCHICQKMFLRKAELKSHHKDVHSEEKPHVCLDCGETFSQLSRLSKHKEIHAQGTVTCPECGERLAKGSMSYHRKLHAGEKPFPCVMCGKSFRNKQSLESHTLTHSRKEMFLCLICNQPAGLRNHQLFMII